jgi:hypothetical protein
VGFCLFHLRDAPRGSRSLPSWVRASRLRINDRTVRGPPTLD